MDIEEYTPMSKFCSLCSFNLSNFSDQFVTFFLMIYMIIRPYIVYMLKEADIMDDWAAIKRAISIKDRKHKRDLKSKTCEFSIPF